MNDDIIPQPVAPIPQEAQAIPIETPPQGFSLKGINKKILIIAGFILGLILVFLISLFVIPKQNKQPVVSPVQKTWEIIFSYNPSKDSFTLTKLTLLNKQIKPDYRGAKFSEFQLNVLSTDNKTLYSSKVPVMTEITDGNMLMDEYKSSSSASPPARQLDNILYAPHFENETRIVLIRNGKTMLDLVLPGKKKASLNFLSTQAYAETCSPIQIVFVSDGYTDMNKYHQDVQSFENAFANTAPYNSKSPSIFDYKIVDNSQPIGCSSNGLIYCMEHKIPLMDQIARAQYPAFSKVVVIANAPEQNPIDGGVLGISSGIGGNYAVFPNNFGNITQRTLVVARHELLGHTVGLLYDRYVSANPGYGLLVSGQRSNCTDNPNGEAFWTVSGKPQATRGCSNQNLYAPAPAAACPRPGNSQLLSAGTPESIMSAVGCGGSSFDPVEQAWISTNILPDYTGCANGSGVTPVVTTNAPIPSTPPASPESNQIIVTVFTDTNNNTKQDSGESGILGASITLSGALNTSSNTDVNGGVTFQNAPAGNYTLVAKVSGQIVGQGSFPIPNDVITTVHFAVPVSPQFAANPTPITIAPTVITPTLSPTPVKGGFEPNGTPAPTPDQYFSCKPDPNCVKSGKTIQLCPLVCTPQP